MKPTTFANVVAHTLKNVLGRGAPTPWPPISFAFDATPRLPRVFSCFIEPVIAGIENGKVCLATDLMARTSRLTLVTARVVIIGDVVIWKPDCGAGQLFGLSADAAVAVDALSQWLGCGGMVTPTGYEDDKEPWTR